MQHLERKESVQKKIIIIENYKTNLENLLLLI